MPKDSTKKLSTKKSSKDLKASASKNQGKEKAVLAADSAPAPSTSSSTKRKGPTAAEDVKEPTTKKTKSTPSEKPVAEKKDVAAAPAPAAKTKKAKAAAPAAEPSSKPAAPEKTKAASARVEPTSKPTTSPIKPKVAPRSTKGRTERPEKGKPAKASLAKAKAGQTPHSRRKQKDPRPVKLSSSEESEGEEEEEEKVVVPVKEKKGVKVVVEKDEGEAEESDEDDEDLLHGFSTDEDSSDEDGDAMDQGPFDVKKLPTVAKDDAVVKQKLDKAKKTPTVDHGVVFLGRIPHGFYEDEMKAYFSQFGTVTRIRLSRNKKTGKSKHYGFIEFDSSSVAKIVADTMDNYLLNGHLLQCKVIPYKEVHPQLWVGANRKWRAVPQAQVTRAKHNKKRDEESMKAVAKRLVKRQNQRKRKLEELGISYDFEAVGYKKPKAVAGAA